MAFGIGGFGFGAKGSSQSSDPADLGLGLLNSISGSGTDSDDFNTPDLSLSKLGTGFDKEIQSAINMMQAKSQVQAPDSNQVSTSLGVLNNKQHLPSDNVKTMSDQFHAYGLKAASGAAGLQTIVSIQEAVVGLQRLVEDYGSKDAAASLGDLYSKLDSSSSAKQYLQKIFEKWGASDAMTFSAKAPMSEETKRSTTRSIQYMLFVSLQVELSEHDPMLQKLRESAFVNEAYQQNGPDADKIKSTLRPISSPLSASEQQSVSINPI